jgi:hypothetical protein
MLLPTDDSTVRNIAEQQVITSPHGTFGKPEPTRHSVQLGRIRNQAMKCRRSCFQMICHESSAMLRFANKHTLPSIEQPLAFFGFIELKEYLERILGRSVDLGTVGSLREEIRDEVLRESVRAA